MKNYKAGFVGIGNMGGALLKSACNSIGGENVAMFDLSLDLCKKREAECGAKVLSTEKLVKMSKYVFLGVKPNVIDSVAEELAPMADRETVFVTMAAGVTIQRLSNILDTDKIIRIMPNTPAEVGCGMILYTLGGGVTEEEKTGFLCLMSKSGKLDEIDENYIDAASAVSGCGPAFVYMFIEALADGGVRCGLPRAKALLYAKETVLGAASLAIESHKHPEQLKDEVCSPGGTTIEGVLTLEKGALRSTVAGAVISAFEKTKKLAEKK